MPLAVDDTDETSPIGRPAKRLSDNPENKTFIKIVDDILKVLEDHADDHGVSPSFLLEELSKRGQKSESQQESQNRKLCLCQMQRP